MGLVERIDGLERGLEFGHCSLAFKDLLSSLCFYHFRGTSDLELDPSSTSEAPGGCRDH
jgi:hypothetical protein